MTRPQELVAELIRKARVRIRELAGCDFKCIHIPIGLRSGQITKAMLEHLLQENEALQFALDSFTGQISIHGPAHKIFNQDAKFTLSLKSVLSRKPLEALTIFTDASGRSHKSVMTWKDPQTQQWEADVAEVEGSPQVAELAAVVRAFERFPEPFNLVTDSAYVAGVVSRVDQAILQEVSNTALFELLSKLVKLVSHREQPFFVMHTRSHMDLPVILVTMEPVQRRSPVLRKFHLLLSILLLASLAAPVSGWLVPQPKANVWATLARVMGRDVHKAIQSIQGMVEDIKKETSDWLSGMFGNCGISGWVDSIIKSILTTHSPSVNRVAMSSMPKWEEGIEWEEDMELEEDSEEDRDLEEEPQVEWPVQLEWVNEACPDSEHRPPPFQFSSS
ncbi:hypothetical protein DUI87_01933 [Hirundo rustica rustica]|uniref:RNase H type-1 domain-containing protein n=1 Tax=Hirundo rustica rustica TaxID=333673 RepID=A0A3M0L7Y2_HIRRU|nr:hypothetical protein DUI87_01933 [Hirundo rustica rustica]